MRRYGWLVLALALLIFILPACAKKDVAPPPVEEPIEEEPPPPPPPLEEEEEPVVEEEEPLELADVFFDYDKSVIKEEFKSVLSRNAELLLSRPEASLLIEGHCDERGTNEYNLALGERRAKSVLDYYVTYGVPRDRLTMISYGEERPFTRGNDESSWSLNRRAHMVIK